MLLGTGMDGLDAYRCMKAIDPDIKVIIASGFADSARILEAQNTGVLRYIKKPFTVDQIGRAVREALDGMVPPENNPEL